VLLLGTLLYAQGCSVVVRDTKSIVGDIQGIYRVLSAALSDHDSATVAGGGSESYQLAAVSPPVTPPHGVASAGDASPLLGAGCEAAHTPRRSVEDIWPARPPWGSVPGGRLSPQRTSDAGAPAFPSEAGTLGEQLRGVLDSGVLQAARDAGLPLAGTSICDSLETLCLPSFNGTSKPVGPSGALRDWPALAASTSELRHAANV
jgi:hypothetical protein